MEQMTQPILVLVENEPAESVPTLATSSAKAVRLATELTAGPVYALSVAEQADTAALAAAGADAVFVPRSQDYSPQVPASVADVARAALERIAEDRGGQDVAGDSVGAVLTVATYLGRAVTAMLAAALHTGGAVDVTDVHVEGGKVLARKSALGGSWVTAFRMKDGFPVLALRGGAGPDSPVRTGEAKVVELAPELSRAALAVQVVSSKAEPKGARVGLTEADVVVVGGRGVDGDFTLVERLADALGGAVGATRVACDEGWVERSAQIGQTGFNVAPKLYVGLGVSGAVHHACGMLGSETIVAVVDDPDAPILEMADFAVVGDVNDVVPQMLEALAADG